MSLLERHARPSRLETAQEADERTAYADRRSIDGDELAALDEDANEHSAPAPIDLSDPITREVLAQAGAVGRELVREIGGEVDEIPRNAVTGEAYNGKNVGRLQAAQLACGYGSGGWAGFKQWLSVGRVVRKGEHGTACMTVIRVADKKSGRETTAPRGFRVFHFDQTVELEQAGS